MKHLINKQEILEEISIQGLAAGAGKVKGSIKKGIKDSKNKIEALKRTGHIKGIRAVNSVKKLKDDTVKSFKDADIAAQTKKKSVNIKDEPKVKDIKVESTKPKKVSFIKPFSERVIIGDKRKVEQQKPKKPGNIIIDKSSLVDEAAKYKAPKNTSYDDLKKLVK